MAVVVGMYHVCAKFPVLVSFTGVIGTPALMRIGCVIEAKRGVGWFGI